MTRCPRCVELTERLEIALEEKRRLEDLLTGEPRWQLFRAHLGLPPCISKILDCLARSPIGAATSRDRLYLNLYGLDPSGGPCPKTIDVHISKGRPKLRRFGIQIVGVWGVGYRLEEASHRVLKDWIDGPFPGVEHQEREAAG